jgi:hypothetical protein
MKKFKFFEGFVQNTFVFNNMNRNVIDAEEELTRVMSRQISDELDVQVVRELTRRINGGELNLQERLDYFERWLDMGGGQRA